MSSDDRIIELLEEISGKLDRLTQKVEDAGAGVEGAVMLWSDSGKVVEEIRNLATALEH